MRIPAARARGILVLCFPAAPRTQAQLGRPEVKAFTVGIKTDKVDQHSADRYAMGISQPVILGPGSTDYAGLSSDKGQIVVDVKGLEPDGGLVLTVSETARTNRSAAPATCVVYPTTAVVCGAGEVQPEETSVIRTLSPKFFDPSALDAARHWRVTDPSAGVTIDFTATPHVGGTTVGITSVRAVKANNGGSEQASGKYDYDLTKLVATSLSEYETIRQEGSAGNYTTIIVDITATLASDSGIAKN